MAENNGNNGKQKLKSMEMLPAAPASLSFKFAYKGYEPTLTLSDFNGIHLLVKMDKAIVKLEQMGAVAPGAAETGISFDAEQMVANVADGNVYWKIRGSHYKKFGVTIWPEVLEEAGFVAEEMPTTKIYDMTGWVAHCELNEEGKPKKVVKLINNNV